jgi:protein SCO1/2
MQTRKVPGPRSSVSCALLILALVSTASVACWTPSTGPQQRYAIKGKVVSVDTRGSTVTIAHQEIPGYMDAMTMPFKLKDERLLKDLAEGDRVQATLVVAGLRSWLEDVVVTRETADPSNLAKAETWVEPKPGDEVPDFKLIDQNGKRFSFHQYRGRIVVLTFIYTRCPLPDYCPLMTDNFVEIEKTLKSEPARYPKTHLLSITLDPEYDSPEVLREYAARHSADSAHWDFATGTKDEVKQIATYFGMQYWRDGDQVVHSLRTAIVGADGKFVKLYRGNEWKPDEIVSDLRNSTIP